MAFGTAPHIKCGLTLPILKIQSPALRPFSLVLVSSEFKDGAVWMNCIANNNLDDSRAKRSGVRIFSYVPAWPLKVAGLALGFLLLGASVLKAQDIQELIAPLEIPFADEFGVKLGPFTTEDDFGPMIHRERYETEETWVFAPSFSYYKDSATDREEADILYPVMTYDRFGKEYRFQWAQVFSFAGNQEPDGTTTERFTLFPFIFRQQSSNTNLNYTAFFPFYGHLKDRLLGDEVNFALFPLYMQSKKQDVVSDNFLFPMLRIKKGESLQGWQFWPLVGREEKAVSQRTNRWDEVVTVAGHKKFFVFWPVYFRNELGLGTDNPMRQNTLLPFYSWQRSPQRDTTSYLWPFFNYIDDRSRKYQEIGAPWPLIVKGWGENKTVNRFFPLFGQTHTPNKDSQFYFWPLYVDVKLHDTAVERERVRVGFFLYSDIIERETGTAHYAERTDLWPLFTARRDREGRERLNLFAFAEPGLPGSKSVERNWSPAWAVWRSERDPKSGANKQAALWSLYRREALADSRKYSLLFGAIQYSSGPDGARMGIFHLPEAPKRENAASKQKAEAESAEKNSTKP